MAMPEFVPCSCGCGAQIRHSDLHAHIESNNSDLERRTAVITVEHMRRVVPEEKRHVYGGECRDCGEKPNGWGIVRRDEAGEVIGASLPVFCQPCAADFAVWRFPYAEVRSEEEEG